MTETLSTLSTVFIYVAMGFYAAAFIAFALDLARREGRVAGRPRFSGRRLFLRQAFVSALGKLPR